MYFCNLICMINEFWNFILWSIRLYSSFIADIWSWFTFLFVLRSSGGLPPSRVGSGLTRVWLKPTPVCKSLQPILLPCLNLRRFLYAGVAASHQPIPGKPRRDLLLIGRKGETPEERKRFYRGAKSERRKRWFWIQWQNWRMWETDCSRCYWPD